MSDISKMTDKQLRNEVQLLRDELAMMKRKYEDIIYNLDTDNFSSRFVKEQGDMKTAIKVTAKGLEAKVSNEEFQNELSLTAEKFETSISNLDLTLSARISLNANDIETEVTNRNDADRELSTIITQNAESISLIAEDYVKETEFSSLFSVAADGILSRVKKVESGKFRDKTTGTSYTLFTQDANKFTFQGDYMDIQSAIRLTDNDNNLAFSMFHQESDGTVYMRGMNNYSYAPVVVGNQSASGTTQPIYLYSADENNLVATRGWVLGNAGSSDTVIARFG